HSCVLHTTGFAPKYRLLRKGEATVVAVQGSLTANETSVVHAAALASAGIAMLPTYYVADDLRSGRLVRVLPRYELDPMDIQAVYLSRRHQPKPLRLLIDFFAERFAGDEPPWDVEMTRRKP